MLYNNDGYTSQTNQDVPHGKPRIDAFVVFIIDTHSYLIDCTGTSNSCPNTTTEIICFAFMIPHVLRNETTP